MKQQHVIEVTYLLKPQLVLLRSYYFDQEILTPLNNEPGSITPAVETAQKFLEKRGFEIVSYCTSKARTINYIVTNTFKPFVAAIAIGDVVYWNDPDNNECSAECTVIDIKGDIIIIQGEGGSLVEAMSYELTRLIK